MSHQAILRDKYRENRNTLLEKKMLGLYALVFRDNQGKYQLRVFKTESDCYAFGYEHQPCYHTKIRESDQADDQAEKIKQIQIDADLTRYAVYESH